MQSKNRLETRESRIEDFTERKKGGKKGIKSKINKTTISQANILFTFSQFKHVWKNKLRADITTIVQKHNELQTSVVAVCMYKNFLLFLRSQGISQY